jgi:hypothetical protein
MAAEFKIGRLRYNWAGTWAPAVEYSRDDVILNDGKAYYCLVPNTSSANFYTDLYNTFPRWQVVFDGKTWVGPWLTNYSYGVGHIVIFGGKAYSSIVAHTSTNFIDNAANWAEYTEFVAWNPSWTTSKAYGENDLVRWGGTVYKCVTNHVSASSSSAGLEANSPAWIVYYSGVEYKGAWVSGTRYKLNDLVKVDANIYRCATYNSDSTFTPSNWSVWLPGQMYDLVWSSGQTYQLGDSIIHGGDAYISKTANNLNNVPNLDSTNWGLFNVGYSVKNNWSSSTAYAPGDLVARNGVLYEATANNTAEDPNVSTVIKNYIAPGSSGTTLNVNSITGIITGMVVTGTGISNGQKVNVVNPTETASALTSTIRGTPITISSFTSKTGTGPYVVTFAIPSQATAPAFDGATYTIAGNSNALYNGTYIATASTTTSITFSYSADPGTYGTGTTTVTPTVGNVLTLGGTVTGTVKVGMLLSGTNVAAGTYIVSGAGTSWVVSSNQSVASTTISATLNSVVLTAEPNGTPVNAQNLSFVGINSAYWSLLIPGKQWANRWANGSQYSVGDVVAWRTGTYVCVEKTSAAPQTNTTFSSSWVLLIAHDPNNALNVQGDLRTFASGVPTAVPITNTAIDLDTYVLGVSTNLPNWRKLNVVPAVYYVEEYSGIDTPTYGVTWDQPWKTIRYACDTISNGFYYPNAVSLLTANKAFMIAEMYQWMLYQMSESFSPFAPDSLWDPIKAQRDAKQIVDAIIYDMKRGGNSQTVAAALSFFYFGSKTQLFSSLVESSIVYYTPALNYLLTVMQSVVTNTVLEDNYQFLNNIPLLIQV